MIHILLKKTALIRFYSYELRILHLIPYLRVTVTLFPLKETEIYKTISMTTSHFCICI